MAIWPFKRAETRSGGDYTETLVNAQLAAVSAEGAAVGQTAALEAVAGLLSRTMAGAMVEGDPTGWINAPWLALCAREMLRRGQHVSVITPTGLVPAESIYWESDNADRGEHERDWRAVVTTHGPSLTRTRTVGRNRLIVTRWANTAGRPYEGRGPHHFASLAARASAESERALGDDASMPIGSFYPVPASADKAKLADLKRGVANAKGKMQFVHTTADNWGEGAAGSKAPHRDAIAARFGPGPGDAFVSAAAGSFARMVAACGASAALFEAGADGTAQREALRRWHLYTVEPVRKLIELELSKRLDADIRLKLDNYAADLAGRASAFQKLVAGGMDMTAAAAASGVLVADDE